VQVVPLPAFDAHAAEASIGPTLAASGAAFSPVTPKVSSHQRIAEVTRCLDGSTAARRKADRGNGNK
jgi:hypothetical protein